MSAAVTRTPAELRQIQHWFAGIITRRIDTDNAINPIAPSGSPIEEEALRYIAPSPTLTSAQRIEIYNQQYWWRLLSVLHEDFPGLVRLFGYHDFNAQIGFPYLERYPPANWSLSDLGRKLPYWLSRHYRAADRKLIQIMTAMDSAFHYSFIAQHHAPLRIQDLSDESFTARPLYLQPHIFLFTFRYHCFAFRDALLEQPPEYWQEHPFPTLAYTKPLAFMVWRDAEHNVGWLALHPVEYLILKKISRGCSLEALCDWLERQRPAVYRAAAAQLQQWTHCWTLNEWLTLESQ